MLRQTHAQLIDIKQWADRGLCATIEANLGRLDAEAVTLLVRVLDHIHAVDRIFQHHLQGLPHAYAAARSEFLPDLQTLMQDIDRVDAWYAAYVRGLAAEDLDQPVDFVFTSGRRARMRRGEILLHVCLHGTYHRGNAGAVLQLKGFAPSRDAITDYLEDAA